jgi:hypothetical protein
MLSGPYDEIDTRIPTVNGILPGQAELQHVQRITLPVWKVLQKQEMSTHRDAG